MLELNYVSGGPAVLSFGFFRERMNMSDNEGRYKVWRALVDIEDDAFVYIVVSDGDLPEPYHETEDCYGHFKNLNDAVELARTLASEMDLPLDLDKVKLANKHNHRQT